MQEDLIDAVRLPVLVLYVFVVLPVTLVVASPLGEAVELDFKAYRLQQFDRQGIQYGSRGWRVMYEAVALDSKSLLRRCLMVFWRDLVGRELSQLFDKTLGAALIVIPADLNALSPTDVEHFMELERKLVSHSFDVPIYLSPSCPPLRETLQSLQTAQRLEKESAAAAFAHAVTANSFQITSVFQGSSIKLEQPIFNVVGKLSTYERSSDMGTIAIIAHYDSFGMAPGLSFGADSNGSGVAALLELIRVFCRFYQAARTRAKYNLVFVLTAGGKLNYQGSRQWIEEYLEQTQNNEGSSGHLELAICLDGLGRGSGLNMHVSKLPADSSPAGKFLSKLRHASLARFGANRSMDVVSKKINLGADLLAWEHERFSIRRLSAVTLSHFDRHDNPMRRSMLDTMHQIDFESLTYNVQVISEGLLRHMYDLNTLDNESADPFLDNSLGVSRDRLENWMQFLSSSTRAAQSLVEKGSNHKLLASLLSSFDRYSHEARLIPINVDKKDPEFGLYGAIEDRLVAYRVKPAVFDLVLAVMIAGYLGGIYLAVLNVHFLLMGIQSMVNGVKKA